MNAPELVVSPSASLRVRGVKVPVAAPSCALDFASAASCLSVRPWAGGNCAAPGFSAAASSSAGCAAAVDEVADAAVRAAVAQLELEEEPQPAAASAPAARAARMRAFLSLMP